MNSKPHEDPEQNWLRRCVGALLLALICAGGCTTPETARAPWQANARAFRSELTDLQRQLTIPGIAFAVVQDGEVLDRGGFGSQQGETEEPFTPATPLPFHSVTKSLTAVIVMQLVGEGALDLEAPVGTYLPESGLRDEIQVRHLLTHTSEGIVGQEFVYGSTRYALLGEIIARVTSQSFEQAVRDRVIEPAGMEWYESPDLMANDGLISTVDQMARYAQELDRGVLLDEASQQKLATPSISRQGSALPLSLGWFAQTIQGTPVMWSYGQSPETGGPGALVFRVPQRKLSLLLLANQNTISDAFRLLMGDARKSPFAMTFFRLFVASPAGEPLARPDWNASDLAAELLAREAATGYRYEDELIGQALLLQWTGNHGGSEALFEVGMNRYNLGARPDAIIHFAGMAMRPPTWMKGIAIDMGAELLVEHPNNRWILLFQAYLLLQEGDADADAAALLQRILALPNQEEDFLHSLFDTWCWQRLAQIYQSEDPEEAKLYLRLIIDSGIGGDSQSQAEQMLRKMN